jgi:hypothetical protein
MAKAGVIAASGRVGRGPRELVGFVCPKDENLSPLTVALLQGY